MASGAKPIELEELQHDMSASIEVRCLAAHAVSAHRKVTASLERLVRDQADLEELLRQLEEALNR